MNYECCEVCGRGINWWTGPDEIPCDSSCEGWLARQEYVTNLENGKVLPCFKCDKEMKSACGDLIPNHPNNGITFTSYGNYGSATFDSIDGSESLEITVCDDCIRKYKSKIWKEDTVEEIIDKQSLEPGEKSND